MESITNHQVAQFRDTATLYLRHSGVRETKLHIALEKMVKKLKSTHEKYLDDQGDVRSSHASIDPDKKYILRDALGYQYTAEKEKAMRKSLRDLQNKSVTFDPHFVSPDEIPPSLEFKYTGTDGREYTVTDYEVRDSFTGFVVSPRIESE